MSSHVTKHRFVNVKILILKFIDLFTDTEITDKENQQITRYTCTPIPGQLNFVGDKNHNNLS